MHELIIDILVFHFIIPEGRPLELTLRNLDRMALCEEASRYKSASFYRYP